LLGLKNVNTGRNPRFAENEKTSQKRSFSWSPPSSFRHPVISVAIRAEDQRPTQDKPWAWPLGRAPRRKGKNSPTFPAFSNRNPRNYRGQDADFPAWAELPPGNYPWTRMLLEYNVQAKLGPDASWRYRETIRKKKLTAGKAKLHKARTGGRGQLPDIENRKIAPRNFPSFQPREP